MDRDDRLFRVRIWAETRDGLGIAPGDIVTAADLGLGPDDVPPWWAEPVEDEAVAHG